MQSNKCPELLQGQLYRPLEAIKTQTIDREVLPKGALKSP